MKLATLRRFAYMPWATFGRLQVGGFACYTVERPWVNNQVNVSCIPLGRYPLTLGRYNRGGYPAYVVEDVPGRSQIKIHAANTAADVVGCIGPGLDLGTVNGEWGVVRSRDALDAFMAAMEDDGRAELSVRFDEGAGRI